MGCGRRVVDGAELIGMLLLMLCLNMLMLDSPLLIWLIYMALLKICMGFSSIEFVVSVHQSYWNSLTKWVPPPVKMTSSYVRDSINVSRKRMDVDSLDMLQFHWWDYSNTGYIDALKHLTDLKNEGKIKTVALTNFDTERLQIILENEIPVVSNQVQHSIVDMRPQQRMAELCQLTGVKLITYGTVMGGLLSEKFLDTNINIPFAGPAINTPSLQKYKRMVDAWGGWGLFQGLLRTLKQVATKHGVSISTVAVKYVLDQSAVAGSMVGVRLGLSDHIRDTNAIFSLVLDEEDVNSIKEAAGKGKDLLKVIGDCGDEYRRA
ncbi:flagellar radial spoke protein 5 isoform X3 [Lotus japonicus]|uniref:flagellar radial spoke protein 5 isoform X3 n=1 Tax=Lotus japonicus TaxID=34305 RepID=UPI0025873565|nr:flagellar radial spoke protein 5 isoform X3 [Lotus japonicus]